MPADVVSAALGVLTGITVTYASMRSVNAAKRAVEQRDAPVSERDEQDRVARLVDTLPFATFIVDARGRISVFNAAAATLFGVDALRAVGRAVIDVIPSVELERMIDAALRGEMRTADVAFGSGTRERNFGITAQPYEAGAMAIASDRTAYLESERVRRDFIGNVSHELRTPLSAMKVMLETVLVADDDAEARTLFLPQIANEVERMIRLVEDLLDLARSESGTFVLRRERFDLTDIATSTVNTFAHRADALRIELELDAPEAVDVEADRGRLTQVAVNLVDNALRHTPPEGRVVVEVARDGPDAVLRVRDTGSGIPFADLPRVFERFYVVDRSRAREHGERAGTGLGLSIAKHLVEAHQGTLVAASVYGQGATFTMRVPALSPEH